MNEPAVIAAVCAGDSEQYAYLVERYQTGLIIHCDRLLNNRSEAEDVAQQAFIRAYEKLAEFNPKRAHFSTWLYRIATNLAIDQLRRQNRSVPTEDMELHSTDMPSASYEATLNELREAVLALQPPEQRRAIEAYYWQGKSYEAIADEMGAPINTVKSWLRRAKAQLRKQLS